MAEGDADEQAVRRRALKLLDDGRKRYEGLDLPTMLTRLQARRR